MDLIIDTPCIHGMARDPAYLEFGPDNFNAGVGYRLENAVKQLQLLQSEIVTFESNV